MSWSNALPGAQANSDELFDLNLAMREGLGRIFRPHDSRRMATKGLWPGPSMSQSEFREKTATLRSILVADTYGGVEAVRWARDAYNARHDLSFAPFSSILERRNDHAAY